MTKPANGLYLDDSFGKLYDGFDKDKDGALVPEEVEALSDVKLAEILGNAIAGYKEQGGGYNNHHQFFNALPHHRIASLFAAGLVDAHYLRAGGSMSSADFGSVLAEILKAKNPESYLTADRLLAAANIFTNQWGDVFAVARGECRDYIDSRTAISLRGLKYADRAKKWDTNGDGFVERKEIEGINPKEIDDASTAKLTDDARQIFPILVEAANSSQHRLAAAYLLGALDVVSRLAISMTILSNTHTDGSNHSLEPGTLTLEMMGRYFDAHLLFDPEHFSEELSKVAEVGGLEMVLSYRETVARSISDTAREILNRMPIVIVTEVPADSETEQKPEMEPFIIDGIPAVTKDDFDAKVLGEKIDPVLVVFGASYCPSCSRARSVVQEIQKDYGNAIKIYTVDTQANRELSWRYSIDGIPAFFLFRNGEIIMRKAGLSADGKKLKEELQRAYPKPIKL